MKKNTYGPLLKRVKAVLIDSLVIIGLSLLATSLLNLFGDTPGSIRLIAFLFIFFLYDPIFTSFIGGTIGHLIMGLRVRNGKNETEKLFFPLAFIRFIVKAFLGWISLLTVSGNKKIKLYMILL